MFKVLCEQCRSQFNIVSMQRNRMRRKEFMTERFSLAEFEFAIVNTKAQNLGLIQGEYCFLVPVKPGVMIYVRSSIKSDGFAAQTAQDSIRAWLCSDKTGKPLGSKMQRWVTRVPGWQERLLQLLRDLYTLGAGLPLCPVCKSQSGAFIVRKPGPNHGRLFSLCPSCNKFLDWITAKEAA